MEADFYCFLSYSLIPHNIVQDCILTISQILNMLLVITSSNKQKLDMVPTTVQIFVSPPNSYVEILIHKGDGISRWGAFRAIRL